MRIAFKNVLRHLKRSLLLGGAIGFGFFVFTLINSFTNGLSTTVERNFTDLFGGHVYVTGSEVSERGSEINVVKDTFAVEDAVYAIEDKIESFNTRSSAGTTMVYGTKEENQRIIGLNFSGESTFLETLNIIDGSLENFLENPNSVILPEDTVDKLDAIVGEILVVRTTTINGQQNVNDLVVAATIRTQEGFGGASGYGHIETVNQLLNMTPDQYQSFNIYLKDVNDIDFVTEELQKEIAFFAEVEPRAAATGPGGAGGAGGGARGGGFGRGGGNRVVPEEERWFGTKFRVRNLNDNLTGIRSLINTMDRIGWIVFCVILAIIMVGIMNSYRMVMLERTAEIGTMRAMGVQKGGIRNIFIWEAFFTALGGALAGLLLALIAMFIFGQLDLSAGRFSFFLSKGHLQFQTSILETARNIAILCAMAVASVYVPAMAAANLKPAEALRTSY